MARIRYKLTAAVEVILMFFVAVLLFRGILASPLHQWESELLHSQNYNFIEYAGVMLLVIAILAVSRRSFATSGITAKNPKHLLSVVAVALPSFLVLGASLSFVNWRQWPGALIVSLVSLGVLVVTALALRKRPASGTKDGLGALVVLIPSALILYGQVPVLVKTLYFYLFVGPAEEVLFRGYIQSRLNETWGRPYRFFGVRWGWGVVAASALFGLWHVALMPLAPGVWLQALWTFVAGLALGYLRERSGSVIPSSIMHGVVNYIPFSELLG